MSDYIRLGDKFTIGKAGEHLTCFDLIKKGFLVSMAAETLPYDLLLDTGYKILKIQVKTTEQPKISNQWRGINEAYIFSVKRKGSNGSKKYKNNEVDIFAVVCLDTMQIGYIKNSEMPTTINIRVDNLKGLYHDEKGLKNCNLVKELKNKNKTIKEIESITGLKETSVRNYFSDEYKHFKTKAPYMSELQKEKEWFINEFISWSFSKF